MPRRFCIHRINPSRDKNRSLKKGTFISDYRHHIFIVVVGDIGGASDVFFPAPPAIILRARFWLVERSALSPSLRARQRRTRIVRHSGARSTPSGGGLSCLSRSLRSSAFLLAATAHLVSKSPARTHGRRTPMFLGSTESAATATTLSRRRDSRSTAVRLRRRRKKQQSTVIQIICNTFDFITSDLFTGFLATVCFTLLGSSDQILHLVLILCTLFQSFP